MISREEFLKGLLAGLLVGLTTILVIKDKVVPIKLAIEYNAAYYHPVTGDFTWRTDMKPVLIGTQEDLDVRAKQVVENKQEIIKSLKEIK